MVEPRDKISAKVISHISLMQSMVTQLPDNISMLNFIKQGFKDLPGVLEVNFKIIDQDDSLYDNIIEQEHTFIIKNKDYKYAIITFLIDDIEAITPYFPYIENFCNMLSVIFEERRQRILHNKLLDELEQLVDKRTNELKVKLDELIETKNILVSSTNKTKAILDSIGDGVIATNQYGKVVSMNPMAELITGYTLSESIDQDLQKIFIIDDSSFNHLINIENLTFLDALKSGVLNDQTTLVNKYDNKIPISHSISNIDHEGEENGIVIIFRDNTFYFNSEKEKKDRVNRIEKQKESLIKIYNTGNNDNSINIESINKLTKIIADTLNTSKVSISLFNTSFNTLNCIDHYDANENKHEDSIELYENDYPNYFNIQKNEWMIISNDVFDTSSLSEFYAYFMENNITSVIKCTIKLENKPFGILSIEQTIDKREWTDDEVSFIRDANQQVGQYFYSIQHKQIENKLKQSQKMEAIGQLAGGVAHDFNNMLGGILGATELLLSDETSFNERNTKYIKLIQKATQRATDLTSKLLLFGRKNDFNKSPLHINNIINETISLLNRSIDKMISIKLNNNATNDTVLGDESQLQNIIMNMCINSSHAMPNGGIIDITTNEIFLDEIYCMSSTFNIKSGFYIEIEIRDNGIGIPDEYINKIFEPFFTTKEQGKGTGLGLSAVYGVVQEHSGAINVYSEIGVGTVFHIYLPITNLLPTNTIAKTIKKGHGTILVVDDEEMIRVVVKAMLEEFGYNVLIAENGKEAVDIYRQKIDQIDVVLLDMIMPIMNGRETFKELKSLNNDVIVILSSGFSKAEDLNILQKNGIFTFMRKPFRKEDLSEVIHRAMEKRSKLK